MSKYIHTNNYDFWTTPVNGNWCAHYYNCHKFLDTPDPNYVSDDLFVGDYDICPVTELPTYPTCALPRIRKPKVPESLHEEIVISPNPVMDMLKMKNILLNSSYKICNIMGEIISKGKIEGDPFNLDVKNLLPGIYFISVDNSKVKIFIKL